MIKFVERCEGANMTDLVRDEKYSAKRRAISRNQNESVWDRFLNSCTGDWGDTAVRDNVFCELDDQVRRAL
jgi:hypothetical protein